MESPGPMHVTLIHNPGAGDEGMGQDELRALLEDAGYRVTYRSTKAKGWKKSLDDPGDLVIAAGGDGTVAKVARQLAGRGVPMAILPAGTANNIARSLNIEAETSVLIGRLSTARQIPLDLGLATGPWGERHFFESFGLGLFPTLMAKSVELVPKAGLPPEDQVRRNAELMLELLEEARPIHCGVIADGRDLSGEYLLIELMNIRSIGPRLDLAPDADPGDGLLDIVTIGVSERAAAADFLRARLAGERAEPAFVRCRARAVRLSCSLIVTHIDDELWPDPDKPKDPLPTGDQMTVKISVDAGAMEMLL